MYICGGISQFVRSHAQRREQEGLELTFPKIPKSTIHKKRIKISQMKMSGMRIMNGIKCKTAVKAARPPTTSA
jgi:hypothetical protein